MTETDNARSLVAAIEARSTQLCRAAIRQGRQGSPEAIAREALRQAVDEHAHDLRAYPRIAEQYALEIAHE